MANEHLILCGRSTLTSPERAWRKVPTLDLCLGSGRRDVHLHIEHLSRKLSAALPPVAVDLVELAAYVYTADQAVTRGGTKEFEYGQKWRRRFRFEVPVRALEVWQRASVRQMLSSVLGFVSDDHYEFGFTRFKHPPPMERYLFGPEGPEEHGFQEVLLFSGGLDSLVGAVREVLQDHHKVALVSHAPVSKVYRRQCDLVAGIIAKLLGKGPEPIHIHVEVNKGKRLGRDFNQRSRSFLFAAIAAVVARLFDLWRVRFYENGVTSFNLPISPQVLGGRASRTTHPRSLDGFARLFTELFERDFQVQNPFLWDTKADILKAIRDAGNADLCAGTSSCTHTWEATDQPHCGRCSQCVDRRLTALAAGLDEREDPPGGYREDVLFGPCEGADLTLVERYVGTARRVERITDPLAFARSYAEVARALRHVGQAPAVAAERICRLYRRHGEQVIRALSRAVGQRSEDLVRLNCPSNCLVRIALGQRAAPPPSLFRIDESVPSSAKPDPCCLVFDDERFEVQMAGKPCPLGNGREYAVLKRMSRRPGTFVSIDNLRTDIWGDEHTEKNTIQRTVSNLRRKLTEAGLNGVTIDGSHRAHYRLVIQL
jgi:DNA-binding response OmpR family regulator/7-cyano-7-deazaguanine synthase in queuosine biosynthesis